MSRTGWLNWKLCLLAAGAVAVATGLTSLALRRREVKPFPIQLSDVTARTGITFRHTDGSSGRKYIVETVASGLATFDYDGDGLIDIYFLNGRPLRGTITHEKPKNRLYRNVGNFQFEDVTEQAGVGEAGYGLGVAVGDYDNDGDPDIYVSNFGPNVLYRNNGDGTFTDVTAEAGVARGSKVGAGASFFDMDGDGDLDLYVANYVDFTYENNVTRIWDGLPIYPGPVEYPPTPDTLYRNNGDGTFTDVSMASGIGLHPGTGMGMICADYDNDGDTDVLVLNDVFGNSCFRNDGTGRFEEVGLANGFKYNGNGLELGSMGIDAADYDNDGWLDFYQTSYDKEMPVLFRNLGGGVFEDVTAQTGAGQGLMNNVKWGCAFADFDLDGWKDLFVGMGHLHDNIELYSQTGRYEATPVLLRNAGDGSFVNVSELAGEPLKAKTVARGVACDDLDNDGRIDVVMLNSRRPAKILRNESARTGHWIQIRLCGVKTNRDGVGARVRLVAGDLVQIDEVHSGRGYQSHFGSRLYFGLGFRRHIDRIEVRWIGGGVDLFEGLPVDRLITLREGEGKPGWGGPVPTPAG
ncbi:MAG: CRTAC1 family protein [Thermoguttaceae bacterium]